MDSAALRRAGRSLMEWFEPRRDAYPWRVRPDPYRVLVSEVMLQQTQASRVAAAFEPFLALFPTVSALAAAPGREVLRAWGSLGYNRRAVALSKAAREIVRQHAGRVPAGSEELIRLPGVGPYTAAAVASLAFGIPVPALDTNVRRVVARALLGDAEGRAPEREVRAAAAGWLDRSDPGGFNQALMDLGREVCRPRPRCQVCPLTSTCRLVRAGRLGRPPRKPQPHSPYRGSFRQVRGNVVDALRARSPATVATLARETGHPLPTVAAAVSALHRDGLVAAGPGALEGRPAGMVRLPD